MMRRRSDDLGKAGVPEPEDRRRSEAGDTLVEVLMALVVVGIAATAILLAFATSISGSGTHRNAATLDTMLRTAAAEVTSAIQQQSSSEFANCSGANTVNTTPGSIPLPNNPLPAPQYTATITAVQYWNPSTYSFTAPQAPATSCPVGASATGPQQLTVTVSYNGASQSITTVVQDPIAPSSGAACQFAASKLVWVQQPDSGYAGSSLFPAPTLVLEDSTGCVVQNDASQVTLAVASGPSGGTLNNCVPNLGYGETTFQNCSLSTIGTYTLVASDPTDNVTSASSNPFSIAAGVPTQIVFKQQPGNGTGGTALTTQPTVWLEDSQGNVVQGDSTQVTLSIGTNPSGGTLSGCTDSTVNGVATFTGCKIDAAGNGYTLTATDATDNLTTPSSPSSPFNVTVGPAYQVGFITSPGTTVAGDKFGTQPIVAIQDAGGNTVTTNISAVSLAIGTNPAGGTLSGCTGSTTAGLATFTGCKIDKPGNGYTLAATDGALHPTTSSTFNIVPPALTSFQVVPSTNTPTAGTAFNVTITALDQSGFPFTGLTGAQIIALSGPSNAPNGNAPAYPASVTFSNGVGTASVTLYDAQSTTLTATQGSASGTSNTFTVNWTGTTSAFSMADPGPQTAGAAFNETVTAVDAYGNTATTYTGSHALTFVGPANSPSGQAPSYPGSVNFTSGVGTPAITLYDAQATTLKATQGALTGTSTAFTVNPAGASKFTVANPGAQTAGTPFGVTITAFDTYGNTATGYTGSQAITFSGPSNSPDTTSPTYPASVTFANGVGLASGITLTDAQSTTLTAAQGGVTGTSTSFVVSGTGTTTDFTLSTPSPTVASAFTETLTAVDTYGNLTAGYTGAKTVTFTGPANSPNNTAPAYPASVSFAAGVGTATITLYDAQSTTLTATQGSISDSSAGFTVSPAAAAKYTVANPGTQTAGTTFAATITALDAYGNTATTYTGAQALVFTGPSNSPNVTAPTYPASVTFAAGVGTASGIKLTDAQSTTLTATKGALTGTSTAFTVNPAGASKFTVANPGAQTAGTPFGVTITAFDTYGNTATGYTGSQAITFSGPSNSPDTTSPTYPASVTFANGVGLASGITLTDAQSTTLTATQGGVTGTSTSFVVSGTGTTTDFTLSTPSPTVASAFTETLTAVDTYGNLTAGYTGAKTVAFSGPANSPNNTAPAYPASVSFAAGVGTATITLYDAQSTTLTATQGSISDSSAGFTVSPAAAAKYTVANPGTQTAGTTFAATITALDAYGNTATTYTGAQALVFTGPSNSPNVTAPTYPASVTFAAGVGTASGIKLTDAQSTTLTATKGALTGTSTGFTVNPAGASKFTVANPGAQTAGTPFGVTITAFDTYGNTATGYTGSQAITFTGPANSPNGNAPSYPASVTFANGVGLASGITLDRRPEHDTHGRPGRRHGHLDQLHGQRDRHHDELRLVAPVADRGLRLHRDPHGDRHLWQPDDGLHRSQDGDLRRPGRLAQQHGPAYPASVSFAAGVGTATITLFDAQSTTLTATQGTITGSSASFTVSPARGDQVHRGQPRHPDGRHGLQRDGHRPRRLWQHGDRLHRRPGVRLQRPGALAQRHCPDLPGLGDLRRGVGTASGIKLIDAQSTTLTATKGALTGTSTAFTVNPAGASKFTVPTPAPRRRARRST